MYQLLRGATVTRLVALATELGIPEMLRMSPMPVEKLAEATGSNPDALYRALRALASVGVFTEVVPRSFGLTPLAETLLDEAPDSLRDVALFWGLAERYRVLGELDYSVRTGHPAFDHVYGTDWWSYLAEHPSQAAIFDKAMGNYARQFHAAAVETYDFSTTRRLVDVGGGQGHLLMDILFRWSQLSAVLFDQPRVIEEAKVVLADGGVADRVELASGDFFQSVPPGADAYLLSMILHDWEDGQAVTILRNIRQAMDPAGKAIVIDVVVPEGDTPHPGKLLDIMMLAEHVGRERTEAEFAALFRAAQLRHVETLHTSALTSLLVAEPA